MKAFSFTNEKGLPQIGIEYQQEFYNFSLAWELYKQLKNKGQGPKLNFLQIMVETDFFHLETFQEVIFALREVRPIDDLKLNNKYTFQPPIGRPQKILCIGRNYKDHAKELGNEPPGEPLFFSKSPSAIIAHQEIVRIPKGIGRVDHEGEIAIVISKKCKQISKAQAFDHIAGFSLMNDITARDMQKADTNEGKPWFRSKSFDTFAPFGPFVVPKEAIHDYSALQLTVKVNGEVRQEGSSAQMIFDFAEIVSYLSKFCTLEPGDVIATGTPAGVSPLKPGDIVEVSVTEIGTLINEIN